MKRISLYFTSFFIIFVACMFIKGRAHSKENVIKPTNTIPLTINLQTGEPVSLHPHLAVSFVGRILERALFEGLTRPNEFNQVNLAAAEKVEISKDKKTYTFTIRPHLWSNGKPVLAKHFENAWKKALAPNTACARAELFYIIKNAKKAIEEKISLEEVGVKAVDDRTLIVELEHPAPYFLDLLSNTIYSPLFDDEKEPKVFNGPFIVETWELNSSLKYIKNPLYWDADQVKLNKIHFSLIKDPYVAQLLYEKGEINYLGDPFSTLPTDTLLSNDFKDHLKYKEVGRTYWISINTEKFPLNSPKIRKALSLVLDRKDLTENILIGQIPHRSPVPKNLSLLKEDGSKLDFKNAIQLFEEGLQELGLSRDKFPPLILSHSNVAGQKSLAETIQQSWEKIFGIEVKIEGNEWNVFFSQLRKKQLQLGGCIFSCSYNDPYCVLEMFKEKNYSFNTCAWENETYKKYLELADETIDESLRKQYLKKAEQLLLEEMPAIPICADNYKYLIKGTLKNLLIDAIGCIDFKKAEFIPPEQM